VSVDGNLILSLTSSPVNFISFNLHGASPSFGFRRFAHDRESGRWGSRLPCIRHDSMATICTRSAVFRLLVVGQAPPITDVTDARLSRPTLLAAFRNVWTPPLSLFPVQFCPSGSRIWVATSALVCYAQRAKLADGEGTATFEVSKLKHALTDFIQVIQF